MVESKNVSIELITDSKVSQQLVGLSFEENSLYYSINMEGPKDRTPVLIKRSDGGYSLIIKNVEMGNYIKDGRAYDIVTKNKIDVFSYATYFTMTGNEGTMKIASDEATALHDAFPVDALTAYNDMPLARYKRFSQKFKITLKPSGNENDAVKVYEADMKYVAKRFSDVPAKDKEIALKVLKELTHTTEEEQKLIEKYMNSEYIDQFDMLNSTMKELGFKYLLADTNLSIHTLTAYPYSELEDGKYFALYDGKKVLMFSPVELNKPFLKFVCEYDNFEKAMKELTGEEKIGVEGNSVPIGRVNAIGFDRVADATLCLSLWRARYAHQTLAYYVINVIATRWAMENALKYAEETMNAGKKITERDVEAKYIDLLREFSVKFGCPDLLLKKYFVVLHAGARSPYPALSSDYVLNKDMNTLKLDSGIHLFRDDILFSGTDLCRMLLLDDKGKQVYEMLSENIRKDVIPNIKDGMTGEDVYWLGAKPLSEKAQWLKDIDMLAKDFDLKNNYARDIGHTQEKEESTTIRVEKGSKAKWENLMLGCIEYQWPYKFYAIGIEDIFFLTPEKSINITH